MRHLIGDKAMEHGVPSLGLALLKLERFIRQDGHHVIDGHLHLVEGFPGLCTHNVACQQETANKHRSYETSIPAVHRKPPSRLRRIAGWDDAVSWCPSRADAVGTVQTVQTRGLSSSSTRTRGAPA